MNLRIQTYGALSRLLLFRLNGLGRPDFTDGTTVYDVLEKGFDDLMDLCDVVTDKFTASRDEFMTRQQS